jgi:two-component system chemotaxis sensor kinase CheA
MAAESMHQLFLGEATELLGQLEEGLLGLEASPDDAALLNSIFRAGHTIKGSAGLLGFTEIVGFTHVLENVLDRLRKNELVIDERLTSALLDAKDVIAQMLRRLGAAPSGAEAAACTRALEALGEYAQLEPAQARQVAAPAATPETLVPRSFRLRVRFDPRVFEQGQDPYLMLLELGDLGAVLRVEPDAEGLPDFEHLDLYRLYLSWTLIFHSSKPLQAIEDVFVFARETGHIEVRQILDCGHWQ